ncbi:MAG: XRE family transcriptional regulator [Syntrophales bacterium]
MSSIKFGHGSASGARAFSARNHGSFNYNLLLLARQARSMNQATLAKSVAIGQGHLSKIENGLNNPTEELVKRFSKVLAFPISFFYQPARVYLPASFHQRMKRSVGERDLDRINAENNIRILNIYKLLQSVEYKPEFPMPQFDIDEFNGNTEKIAELVRRAWLLPRGPIMNLTECIERAGALIIWCDFGDSAVDGVTLSIHNIPPCIFINYKQPADRMRFTLAHELGHIVMHQIPSPDMEKEANEFASAFLMPRSDIQASFRVKITLPYLASLKPIWRVAMQALLMRAKALGAVDTYQNSYLWRQINRQKIKFHEPPELDFPHEMPTVFPKLLKIHLEHLGYSIDELAKILHLYPDDFQQLYQFPNRLSGNGHLRIVP